MKICIVIPNYNHGSTIASLLAALQPYQLPCIIVDDGSDQITKQQLAAAVQTYSFASIVTLPNNLGKGGAVIAGLRAAWQQSFTHVIQLDADGQHDTADLPTFLNEIAQHPQAVILGSPIYDATIPKGRLYGRKITNFWVSIETLSFAIKDAMCGFRAYPLALMMPILDRYKLGLRMDFDIEIIVRLYWAGAEFIAVPTKVIYPEAGVSHFDMVKDNIKISLMHSRLFFGMLLRFPKIIAGNIRRSLRKNNDKQHWFQIKERGALWGLKFVLYSYRYVGRYIAYWFLYPIVGYFYLFGGKSRRASKDYLQQLATISPKIAAEKLSSYDHFMSFASSALDKLSVWNNDIKLENIEFVKLESLLERLQQKKGAMILTAHLGNIEIARALSRFQPGAKVNALVFTQNARKFNQILEQVNPECKLNLIEVNTTDIQLAMELKQKIEDGELIVIVGDRTSTTNPGRLTKAEFLQRPAYFPQGPFILAGLMHCPVYFMLCIKQPKSQQFKMIFENFAESINIQRKYRQENLQHYTQLYADLLTKYCQQYPLQWFNFFDIWQDQGNQRER
jgi:predicted LPLAT superfamily acyltransferase